MGVMMIKPARATRLQRSAYRLGALALVLFGTSLLGACSQVPDAINPAEWYRSATGGPETTEKTQAPGADQAFPKINSVDQQIAARDSRVEGLAADTQGRKYADSVQRQSEDAQNSLYKDDKPPATPQVEAPAPAPAAPKAEASTPAPQPPMPADTAAAAPAAPAPAAPAPAATAESKPSTDPAFGVGGMRDRLAQQLAEIRARAADRGSLLPLDAQFGNDSQPTVIVSSAGIETERAPSLSGPQGIDPLAASTVAGLDQINNQGALPLPEGATRVATILFNDGSSQLDSNDRQILADVARLQQQSGRVVRVIGHASQRTQNMDFADHKLANLQVSEKRANQIAAELQRMGVAQQNILIAAIGDNRPIYQEIMPSGEAGNRRAEIYLSN